MPFLALLLVLVVASAAEEKVDLWGIFEVSFAGPADDVKNGFNAFDEVVRADFGLQCGENASCEENYTVYGFYDGDATYRVRFSPPKIGIWSYVTQAELASLAMRPRLDGKKGTFECVPPADKTAVRSKGPVVTQNFGFVYQDGSEHFSVGTTAYQWASMDFAMQEETLETLRAQVKVGGFNKIRMTVFPKWYIYNHQNPVDSGTAFAIKEDYLHNVTWLNSSWYCGPDHLPIDGSTADKCPSVRDAFDLTRFNTTFWQRYEKLLGELREMGVVADIILFHPYDSGHWGFDCLGGRDPSSYNTTLDKRYLDYLVRRFGAYSNVWYAMANEWDFNSCKRGGVVPANQTHNTIAPIWDDLFKHLNQLNTLGQPVSHKKQISIHNGAVLYDHSKPWISHVSLQGYEDQTSSVRAQFKKPLIWDEVRYEGDIVASWGALSAAEEADRFFLGFGLGVYVGHSECLLNLTEKIDDKQPLWWAKGGNLKGQSALQLIPWFHATMEKIFVDAFRGATGGLTFFANANTSVYKETCGSAGGPVANVVQLIDQSHEESISRRAYFLYFTRFGERWEWAAPTPSSRRFKVVTIDYFAMTTAERTYDFSSGAAKAVIPFAVSSLPYSAAILELHPAGRNFDGDIILA